MSSISTTKEFTKAEAVACLEEAKTYGEKFGRKLIEFHDRKGWVAMGYTTFQKCCERELGEIFGSRSRIYRLMQQAEVAEVLSPIGDKTPPPPPPSLAVAREISKLNLQPEQQREVYASAVAANNGAAPTAKQVVAAAHSVVRPAPNAPPVTRGRTMPQLPAIADHEYEVSLKRIGTVCGRAIKQAIESGTLDVDRADVLMWSKESDEDMLRLKELVGGLRMKVRESLRIISQMPTEDDKVKRLCWLAMVEEDGRWTGTIAGVEFKLQVVAKKAKR